MNNFQYVVRYNTRYAMHVAVELCEQGDFDDIFEAVKWLMQERDETPKKCSTCQYRYVVGQKPYPSFGYMCGFGDGKKLCGSNTSVLDHMSCEHWEKNAIVKEGK